ncbi:hypothetical protein IHQ71_06640 [Rhizobium sp. TH2]|uniref:calcium-binding protein n=1 Tax=Rhizobium sp. TH2 TaxID=2775403 RepID=UPI002157AC02|nr:calcium-binding protein [Rhizobium sp. TH2]UVC10276.1 hypothetical protein IHQ71_06640 [Rhizobium sp. TH2]
MTSQTITADFTSTIFVPDDNDILLIAKGVTGKVAGTAIDAATASENRQITIRGSVEALADINSFGLVLGDFDNGFLANGADVGIAKTGVLLAEDIALRLKVADLNLTNDGLVRAAVGMSGGTPGASIVNNGRIIASSQAIDLLGSDISLENYGLIRSDDTVVLRLNGGDNVVRNHGVIEQRGTVQVVEFTSFDGSSNLFVNHGTVKGGSTAVVGRDGNERVVNFGRFDGGVTLGDGDDVFVNRGTVGSTVSGGLGDDEYFLYNNKVELGADSGGADKVFTNISIKLADGIESLELLGRQDIRGAGNAEKNTLLGNAGDNVLNGGEGSDQITGGLGNDRLIGGEDVDRFVFADGFGRDVIADYDFSDRINLNDVSSAIDFDTIEDFAKQTDAGVVINFGLGDKLTILDIEIADLESVDFTFFRQGDD